MNKKIIILTAMSIANFTLAQPLDQFDTSCPTKENLSTLITKETTAVEVLGRMLGCMEQKDNPEFADTAVYLFGLAGSMTLYDKARVVDTTAHDASAILRSKATMTEPFDNFKEYLLAYMTDNDKKQSLCESLINQAAPTYYPSYMINHGMAYMQDPANQNTLNTLDNPQKTWKASVQEYLLCK